MPHYDLDGRLVVLNRLPELRTGGPLGRDDTRHRVYTQDYLPWGVLPLWEDGGPESVPLTDWTVQYLVDRNAEGEETGQIELYVHRAVRNEWAQPHRTYSVMFGRYVPCNAVGCCARLELHELSGKSWTGIAAARHAAYDVGLIGLRVYESDAAGYGFQQEAA